MNQMLPKSYIKELLVWSMNEFKGTNVPKFIVKKIYPICFLDDSKNITENEDWPWTDKGDISHVVDIAKVINLVKNKQTLEYNDWIKLYKIFLYHDKFNELILNADYLNLLKKESFLVLISKKILYDATVKNKSEEEIEKYLMIVLRKTNFLDAEYFLLSHQGHYFGHNERSIIKNYFKNAENKMKKINENFNLKQFIKETFNYEPTLSQIIEVSKKIRSGEKLNTYECGIVGYVMSKNHSIDKLVMDSPMFLDICPYLDLSKIFFDVIGRDIDKNRSDDLIKEYIANFFNNIPRNDRSTI